MSASLIAAFALCALAGCGGGGGSDGTSQVAGAPTPAPAPPTTTTTTTSPAPTPTSPSPPPTPTSPTSPTPSPTPPPTPAPGPAPTPTPTPGPSPSPVPTPPPPPPAGPTYVVGTATPLPAGATRVATMMAVPWTTLPAGSTVLVSPGTYSGVTTIAAVGTSASPIVVTAFDAANPPTLTNSVDFQGAAYVQVSHLTVQSPSYAGFIVRLGSQHVTVSDSTINAATSGVSITDGAGIGHQVLRNTINGATVDGISVDVNSDATTRTLISGNTITGSAQHGIELRASHYQVEHNVISGSGAAQTGGVSGIHVYRGTPTEDSGADNLVRYNASYGTSDPVAADGNGIEIDQWCNGNAVAYNLVWNNDGAGILVFDANGNTIEGNTAYGDGVDPGHTHTAALGELIIGATSAGSTTGNHAWNNLLASTRTGVPGLYIDTRALAGGNTIGANLYYSAGAAPVRWSDSAVLSTAAQIDASTGVPGSVTDAPSFTNAAAPLSGGLRLAAHPTRPGVAPTGDIDFAGTAVQSGWYFLGAYFTAP